LRLPRLTAQVPLSQFRLIRLGGGSTAVIPLGQGCSPTRTISASHFPKEITRLSPDKHFHRTPLFATKAPCVRSSQPINATSQLLFTLPHSPRKIGRHAIQSPISHQCKRHAEFTTDDDAAVLPRRSSAVPTRSTAIRPLTCRSLSLRPAVELSPDHRRDRALGRKNGYQLYSPWTLPIAI